MFSFLLQQVYSDKRGMDKNHHGQDLPEKTTDKTPGQIFCELRQILLKLLTNFRVRLNFISC